MCRNICIFTRLIWFYFIANWPFWGLIKINKGFISNYLSRMRSQVNSVNPTQHTPFFKNHFQIHNGHNNSNRDRDAPWLCGLRMKRVKFYLLHKITFPTMERSP